MTRTNNPNRIATLVASAAIALATSSQASMICPSSGNAFLPDSTDNNEITPVPGTGVQTDCWTGPNYANGITRSRGWVFAGSDYVQLQAYLFSSASNNKEARVWGVSGSSLLSGCYANDISANGQWGTVRTINASDYSACAFAQHFRVVAYNAVL